VKKGTWVRGLGGSNIEGCIGVVTGRAPGYVRALGVQVCQSSELSEAEEGGVEVCSPQHLEELPATEALAWAWDQGNAG